MVMPDIELRGGSQATVFEGARIHALAVGVPEDNARFEGQVVAFVDELLEGIEHGEHLRFCSSRGETYTIAAGDLSGFALLSTNAPSWKLVPAGRAQLAEITEPRFLLRDVESIELHAEPADLGTSDQVFTNLSDALQQPTRVRFLSLTSARLESFPTGVFELTELESLNLGKNRIEELPAEIGDLRGLKVLKLSRNRLTALSNEIGRLKQLEELHLSRNRLVELPEKLWNLESLRFMNLGRNKLRDVPQAISGLGALRERIAPISGDALLPARRTSWLERLIAVLCVRHRESGERLEERLHQEGLVEGIFHVQDANRVWGVRTQRGISRIEGSRVERKDRPRWDGDRGVCRPRFGIRRSPHPAPE